MNTRQKFDLLKTLLANATEPEIKLRELLIKERLQFKFQAPFDVKGNTFFIDFLLHPKDTSKFKFIAIEVDGYNHTTLSGQIKDEMRSNALFEAYKMKTYRITNREVMTMPEAVIQQILSLGLRKGQETFSDSFMKKQIFSEKEAEMFAFKVDFNVTPQKMREKMDWHKSFANSENCSEAEKTRHFSAFCKYRSELKRLSETRERIIKRNNER